MPYHVAVLISGFATGGVPRVMSTLAGALAERGHQVDLLAADAEGPALDRLPAQVRLVDLRGWRRLPTPPSGGRSRRAMLGAPAVARYLRSRRPDVLLSGGNYPNFAALAGRALARAPLPVVVTHHAHLALEARRKPLVRAIVRHVYPRADRVVAVSQGVADELVGVTGLAASRVCVIYNPAAPESIVLRAQEAVRHPWLAPGEPPLILGAGRLHRQKDFPTLLRAFSRVRAAQPARLVILGTGEKADARKELLALAAELGVAGDVELPGWVENPYAWMARASAFVLSSAWEGLPTALIEALACGCPVVSTDCPSGPAEILEGGRHGPLVPVGDDAALADAVLGVLRAPPESEKLRVRAADFSVEAATDSYLALLAELTGR
jgi:glycosyltransferase involved in cell wall biosynthesis